jgi:LysM repeat protein
MDYGRAYSPNESALSDFNGILVMPERIKDHLIPLTFGAYAEAPATGAHIVELSAGGAIDAPLDRWTRGILRLPARFGLTAMLRHQKGELKSDRVGSATISLGLTSGFLFPINKRHQVGFAIRNLFLGEGEPSGPSAHVGILRHHRDYLDAYAELEYAKGGIWRVHPGLEWLFSRGVLRPRLGWAHRESGKISHVSTGIGFYLSPLQIDMAYLVPVKTTNDNSGQFRASFVYRFGKPQFSEIYFDRALEAASQLDQRVLSLTVKEAETKSSLAETEQKRKLAREELENMKKRIQQLKDEDLLGQRDETIRQLKARVKQLEADLSENRSTISAMRQKKAEIRTHLVSPGDTLQSLAQQYYGDPNQWKKIFNANPDKIDRGLPKPGSKLVIP